MNSYKFLDFDISIVEKTIHYIRFNIEKEINGKYSKFLMCYVTLEGEMAINNTGTSLLFKTSKDIINYNKLLTNVYNKGLEMLGKELDAQCGDIVLIFNSQTYEVEKGTLQSIDYIDKLALIKFSYTNSEKYFSRELSKLINVKHSGKISILKENRRLYNAKKIKDVQTKIDDLSLIIQSIETTMSIIENELINLANKLSKEQNIGRNKSLNQKQKGLKRLNIKLSKHNKKLNTLTETINSIVQDYEFNNTVKTAINGIVKINKDV